MMMIRVPEGIGADVVERRDHRAFRASSDVLERRRVTGGQVNASHVRRLQGHRDVHQDLLNESGLHGVQRVGMGGVGDTQDDDVGVTRFQIAAAGDGDPTARELLCRLFAPRAVARTDRYGVSGSRPAQREAASLLARATDDADSHDAPLPVDVKGRPRFRPSVESRLVVEFGGFAEPGARRRRIARLNARYFKFGTSQPKAVMA